MPKLVQFTTTGIKHVLMINPIQVVGVVKEDENGKPFIICEPHPTLERRVYVDDSYEEIVAKLNSGLLAN